MEPIETLKKIFEVGKFIYDRVQTVKANKAQCLRFYDRVKIVLDACQGLDKATNLERYRAGLEALEKTLNESLQFITKFSADKNWFKQFISAGSHKDQFAEFAEHLWNDVQLLQLGIGAQQIRNRDEDKVDISKDMIELQACQEEILRLNRDQNAQLLQIHFDQTEQHKLLEKQLDSIRDQIAYATGHKKPEKPLLDPKLTTPFYELEFEEKLAEGSFAIVYKGRWLHTPVAIKLLSILSDVDLKQFSREVDIMSRLRHPNIVQLYSACLEQGRACLVMEYMPQQNLRKMLDAGTQLITKEKNQLALSICQGLHYLHHYGVLHRDLRSNNVLLTQNYQTAKLSDFGFAKTNALSVQSAVGTKPIWQYLAPELMHRVSEVSVQSDIYSLGIILWELYTGKRPYEESGLQPKDILMGKRETVPVTIPTKIAALIKQCWATKPFERPTLDDLIEVFETALLRQQINPEAERIFLQGQAAEKINEHINAYNLYCEADKLGHIKAKANKAFYLLTGRGGVVINKVLAHSEMVIAAEAGHDRAQYNLAQILEYGDGVPKNLQDALHYYDLATRQNYPRAKENFDKLKVKLDNAAALSTTDSTPPSTKQAVLAKS